MAHPSWAGTSPVFRSIIIENALKYRVLTYPELGKYLNK
jgi:hypothetical protein